MSGRTMKRLFTVPALCLWACTLSTLAQVQAPAQAQDYDHSLYVRRGSGPGGRNHPWPLFSLATKSPLLTTRKSNVPPSVIKDIQRVRPGMTRGDLDWLFVPDGGVIVREDQAPYIYRYGEATVVSVGADGKPIVDKITHKPVTQWEAIKIDVKFKPVPANARGMARLHPPIYPNGKSDDIIISVSEPYVAFSNDN